MKSALAAAELHNGAALTHHVHVHLPNFGMSRAIESDIRPPFIGRQLADCGDLVVGLRDMDHLIGTQFFCAFKAERNTVADDDIRASQLGRNDVKQAEGAGPIDDNRIGKNQPAWVNAVDGTRQRLQARRQAIRYALWNEKRILLHDGRWNQAILRPGIKRKYNSLAEAVLLAFTPVTAAAGSRIVRRYPIARLELSDPGSDLGDHTRRLMAEDFALSRLVCPVAH